MLTIFCNEIDFLINHFKCILLIMYLFELEKERGGGEELCFVGCVCKKKRNILLHLWTNAMGMLAGM